MVEPSAWARTIAAGPEHSQRYAARWRRLAAEGQDLDGEARMTDAMAARGSRPLEAGYGTGRVGGRLAQRGHTVVGVDVDPALIEYATTDFPHSTWLVSDLALLDLPAAGVREPFEAFFADPVHSGTDPRRGAVHLGAAPLHRAVGLPGRRRPSETLSGSATPPSGTAAAA